MWWEIHMPDNDISNFDPPGACPICHKVHPAPADTCLPVAFKLPPKQPDRLTGTTLGNYEIETVLGQGGMSIVYKATHRVMKNVVAIKMRHSHLVMEGKNLKRFEQEARAAAAISHPNVLAVRDFGVNAEGHPYLVMDYLEGRSLSDAIKRDGPLPLDEALDILIQVCDALADAHRQSIVHRDLKPSNVMLVKDTGVQEKVKLVDFGIAKILPAEGEDSLGLTNTGEVFGSPLYMSPEQCMGMALDHRTDIYSFGCVMYETFMGKTPFGGTHVLGTMHKHINEPPPPLIVHDGSRSQREQLDAIVFKALEKDPSKRHQTMLELKSELMAVRAPPGGKSPLKAGLGLSQFFRSVRRTSAAYPRARLALVAAVLCVVSGFALPTLVGLLREGKPQERMSWVELRPQVEHKPADFDKEEREAFQLISLINRIDDPGSVQMLRVQSKLAGSYARYGMWPEAAKYYGRSLELVRKEGSQGSLVEADGADSLADAYFAQGLLDQAEPLYQLVLFIRSRVSGSQARQLASPLFRLGEIYYRKGDLARAESMFERMSEIRGGSSPGDKSSSAMATARLAEIYARQGNLDRAEEMYREAVAYWEKIQGPERRNLVSALDALAGVLVQERKFTQADAAYKNALRFGAELLGDKSPFLAPIMKDYANLLWKQNRFMEAVQLKFRARELS